MRNRVGWVGWGVIEEQREVLTVPKKTIDSTFARLTLSLLHKALFLWLAPASLNKWYGTETQRLHSYAAIIYVMLHNCRLCVSTPLSRLQGPLEAGLTANNKPLRQASERTAKLSNLTKQALGQDVGLQSRCEHYTAHHLSW